MSSARGLQALEVSFDGSVLPTTPSSSSLGAASTPAPPCGARECFERAVSARANAQRTVIVAVTNEGFAHFWHNLRCTLERLGLARHALIVGTDTEACAAASAPGAACLLGDRLFWPPASPHAQLPRLAVEHGTSPYARLMHVKARPCLEVLRLGFSVLSTDTDVVFLRDPLADLARRARLLDVLVQSDHDESNAAACDSHHQCARSHWCNESRRACAAEVCGGFFLMRPGPAESMLERVFAHFARQRAAGETRIGEQPALNFELRRSTDVAYGVLPRALYPNGAAYFGRGLRPRRGQRPYVVHNNWLRGAEAKQARFEAYAMWHVAEGGRCLDADLDASSLGATVDKVTGPSSQDSIELDPSAEVGS